MIIVTIIVVIIVILVVDTIAMYNSFIKLRNNCEEAFSTMDVYMKKRFDLIPNLVETVKGYAAHEKETLEKVIAARNSIQSATTVEEKMARENVLQGTLKSLFAVAEAYPDLKANTNFLDLQDQLKSVEEDIANSRKYYNAVVRLYNNKVQVFPNNIFSKILGFKREDMFEAKESERESIQVDLNEKSN